MAALKFLIIEDSPTMRQLIRFALKRLPQAEVIEASDGVDGLKKLSSNEVDLILTDINMPIMDGLKLVSLVRGNDAYKDIPIVIITTEGAQEDRERAVFWWNRASENGHERARQMLEDHGQLSN